MRASERMSAVAKGEAVDRVPFVPTVYEHAAALLGVTPSEMARSADLIVQGQLKAHETYGHDLVVVGVDIYNIEAEALGTPVRYGTDAGVPALAAHIVPDEASLARLALPDPERSGRMPLLMDAAARIKEALDGEVPVGAAAVGPFTLAALLRGFEDLVLDMLTGVTFVDTLLDFTEEVCFTFGRAIAARGLGLSLNESWITPPLLSPRLYAQYVFPRHKRLIARLRAGGAENVSLISGGNTTPIVDWLVQTGSSLLMADYGTDLSVYREKARLAGIMIRGSIQAHLMEDGSREEIAAQAHQVLSAGAVPGSRFILGCGVLPYGADPRRVLYLKELAATYA